MALGLKNFLINEELKTSHAERYLTYVDRYHEEVFHDLKKHLGESWEKTIKSVLRDHPVHSDVTQDILLQNPKATLQVKLTHTSERFISSRSPIPLEASPSIKVPLIYSKEERDMITKKVLISAQDAFEDTVHGWREIFNYEKKGRIAPWFKIDSDREEVRLKLAVTEGDHEAYKTLYAVRLEYGRKGSKVKDFDRVYLVNLIKQ